MPGKTGSSVKRSLHWAANCSKLKHFSRRRHYGWFSYAVQTNIVRRDGRRAVLMTVLKGEGASTLDVVRQVRAALPGIQAQLPPALTMGPLFDQSIFVRAAVSGVLKEGAIAAGLTALMILLFLG